MARISGAGFYAVLFSEVLPKNSRPEPPTLQALIFKIFKKEDLDSLHFKSLRSPVIWVAAAIVWRRGWQISRGSRLNIVQQIIFGAK